MSSHLHALRLVGTTTLVFNFLVFLLPAED